VYSKIKIADHPVHPMLIAFPVAALPGLADWAFGIPRDSAAKKVGMIHAGLNVIALGLFLAAVVSYAADWNGPPASATLGVVLSAIGLALTAMAGFFGWMLVQDYHVGVRLVPEQELAEPSIQHTQPGGLGRRHVA
jgi:uncharacterized membrane protein